MAKFVLLHFILFTCLVSASSNVKWRPAEIEIVSNGQIRYAKFIHNKKIKTYRIFPGTAATQKLLKRFTDGDVIAAEARFYHDRGVAVIRDIERVGLKRILGYWAPRNSSDLYHFDDFVNLKLYQQYSPYLVRNFQEYNYIVSPSHLEKWNVILSSPNGSSMVGTLQFKNMTLNLELFDHHTGKSIKNLTLDRIIK